MRVLVTGSNGFTGRYVESEFSRSGWQVFGLGAQPEDHRRWYRQVDLLDVDALGKCVREIRPHAVVHLAAVSFVGHKNASEFYRVNMLGTRNLLEALTSSPINLSAVLIASSANVYGHCTDLPITEASTPNPTNDYAVSKLAMEYVAKLYFDRLPVFFSRPFNYTGIGQAEHFLVPKIVAHFSQRAATIELGNLDVSRDFSDVRCVARAYRLLVERPPLGETVNVCSGIAHSVADILQMCTELTGHRIGVTTARELQRTGDPVKLVGSNARLKSLIPDWTSPNLRETLAWMLGGVDSAADLSSGA